MLAVMSAAKKMNLKTLKKLLSMRNIKIADAAEALTVTVIFRGEALSNRNASPGPFRPSARCLG